MIKHQQGIPKFRIAKASRGTEFCKKKKAYRKNIEKGIIISITLMILLFRLASNYKMNEYIIQSSDLSFDLIDILQLTPPPIEEPPVLEMEAVIEIPPPEEELESDEEKSIKEIIEQAEDLLSESSNEVELTLASNSNYLMSDSPLSGNSSTDMQFRLRSAKDKNSLNFGKGRGSALNGGGLDIGETKREQRRVNNSTTDLNIGLTDRPARKSSTRKQPKRQVDQLNFNNGSGKILSFASVSIETDGYKVWNKIISELDRLKKGRYGDLNSKIVKRRGGFGLNFQYRDGTSHEINWRNDGNVWIRVLGESKRTTAQELKQALSSLLRLSF